MNNPLHFFTELFKRPAYEIIWVFYMMMINMAALFFWEELLAKVIFIIFMLSSMLMMGLYSKFGFTKILGLGHILWLPLVVYIAVSLPGTEGLFFNYLIILLATTIISLLIDIYDVWSYFRQKPAQIEHG
jgi:hypothetical protein